jgi:hypothetical protein
MVSRKSVAPPSTLATATIHSVGEQGRTAQVHTTDRITVWPVHLVKDTFMRAGVPREKRI